MRIALQHLELNLAEPFASNKGTLTQVRQVLVRLDWQGLTGFGTSSPADVSETTEAIQRCAPLLADVVIGDLSDVHQVLCQLEPHLALQPAALSAVDMALHDLLGKSLDLPLHAVLGQPHARLAFSALSLGAVPSDQLVKQAAAAADWPILKLKITAALDLDQTVQRVDRVRDVYPGRIWIDANGAWEPHQAIAAADALDRRGVELIEQPIPAGRPDLLQFIHDRSPLPIVADEDCVGPADVERLAGCVDIVNIKLLKCGGLRRAARMLQDARRNGLSVMLGCKTESVLGVSAMAQLAPCADYVDLDGHLDLVDDPFVGLDLQLGKLSLSEMPGLGVRLRSSLKEDN